MPKNNILITANLDEISDNLQVACDFFVENELKYVEIRTINKKNIIDYSLDDVIRFSNYLNKRNLKVAAIASPLFKWYLNKPINSLKFDSFYFNPNLSKKEKTEYILKTFEIAKILDTKIIRIFSNIKTSKSNYKDLLKDESFIFAIKEAQERNICLALENEPICILNRKKDIRRIVKKFKSLKIWFDIANFYQLSEQVTEEDLIELKDSIVYFHVKDFKKNLNNFEYRGIGEGYVPVGEGYLNYKRITSDILSIFNHDIFLSLETHVKHDKINATQKSLDNLRRLIDGKRIKYAIIGAGKISSNHSAAIRKNENSELRGVFDIVRSKTISFAKENDAIDYRTIQDVFNDESIDIVNICTPHDTHLAIAKQVVSKNKRVLCEKPFVLSKRDLQEALLDPKIRQNVFIVMQNNFNPAIKFLYRLINERKLGKINYFSVNIRWWRDEKYFSDWHGSKIRSGGSLFNQGIHGLGIINRVIPLQLVKTNVFTKILQGNSELEDVLVSIIKLKGGQIGCVEVFLNAGFKNVESSIFLSGTKGTIKIGGIAFDEILHLDLKNNIKIPEFEKSDNVYGHGHSKLIETLSNYLLGVDSLDSKLLVRPLELKNIIDSIETLYAKIG